MGKLLYGAYACFNNLYKHFYPLYRPLYSLYKLTSDREKIALIRQTVKPGATVLDIGANSGFYSVLFARLAGEKGRVIGFEPDGLNFRRLTMNTRRLPNVTVHQLACSDRTGKLKLYLSERFNVDHQTFDSGEGRKCVEVQAVSVDDFLRDHEKADFIKIDVQGYDYHAVKGAVRTIEASPSLVILGELWPYGLHRAGVRPSEYLALLRGLGLTVKVPHAARAANLDDLVDDRYFYTDFWAAKKA